MEQEERKEQHSLIEKAASGCMPTEGAWPSTCQKTAAEVQVGLTIPL